MVWSVTIVVALGAAALGWLVGRRRTQVITEQARSVECDNHLSTAVVDGHRAGVVVADAGGRITYRNRAALQLAGTHVGVLIDDAIEQHIAQSIDGSDEEETIELYGPPRKVVTVASQALPDGGAVVFVTDITEAYRLDQVRTDFVANISHELKTPIGALSVLAETLIDETDPATMRRVIGRMVGEAERASRTVDDLMELSRIELDAERFDSEVVVGDVIRAAVDRVTELAAQRSISISTLEPVDDGVARADGLVVSADRRQLVSAIGNLVENAVKYSETGAQVKVRSRATGAWIEIVVSDQGVGIPQRDLDRIFERFYRVDRARSRATGGTGLGLSIVRHVANNHDGEVVVSSTEGVGSEFVFRLPSDMKVADPESDSKEGAA